MPARVRTIPRKARSVTRSSRKITASGIANMGAVDERTEATATPACLTAATNMTELTDVIAPRTTMRTRTPRLLLANVLGTARAHGVSHSTIEATGSRIACAVIGLISASGGLTSTVETAQASDAIAAAPTPNQKRSSGARSAHGATIKTRPAIVTSEPSAIGTVTGSSRKTAAISAAPSGYVVEIVMARPTPIARVLSKKTVSPSAMAVTIESPSKSHAPAEIVVKAPLPAVASTQATRSAPPIEERIALIPTEPSSAMRERARRLVTAHATAEPRAARAPNVVSSITSRRYPLDNPGRARRRSYTVKFVVYAAVLAGAFVAFSLLSFWLAVRPPRIAIPLSPGDVGLTVEAVTIAADDGAKLAAWLVPRAGAPALVLLHGYPADKADLLPIAAALAPRFTVLLLDQRYFGASGGHATTLGFRERADLARALDFLAARGFDAVGVFGFSLGGAVALLTAAEEPRIRAVAAYAPFADLRTLAHQLYGWLWYLKYPFVGLLRGWSLVFFGHDITAVSPERAATRLTIPVLLVASRRDEQIPFAHAERISRALARDPRNEIVFMDRGRHGELPPDFEASLARFFLLYVK